ncbi:ABC transporter permease [Kutzneria buriramensis]|uniref:ABC-2 type transport system permease protein n=1 Tax=Kutzneria buriramensis TaxID=1045776 RepID=A0A3E0H5M9_9PSEU|nr:ABC transporter permease [Kutzneria buriramensis]REH38203.1 ABC-2 type transport system permease protein [Kutzneria buriramensis]
MNASAGAYLLSMVRNKIALFFTFAFPLLFIVLFGLLFGGPGHMDQLAAGVLDWGVGNAAMFGVAYTIVQWRRDDLLRLVRTTPTPVTSLLSGWFAVVLGIAVAQAALFLGVSLLPVFGLTVPFPGVALLPVVLLFGCLAFFAMGVVVGRVASNPDAVGAIANCVMIPMAFLSGSFYPLELAPHWMTVVSRFLPLRYLNDATRTVLTGQYDLVAPLSALLGFAVLFGAIGLRTFKWADNG